MSPNAAACVAYVQSSLAEQANPEKAEGIQAYMKRDVASQYMACRRCASW
jgi:hypothetical protein